MERKKALVIAGSVTLTVFAGGAAMAANLGLLGAAGGSDPVGQLDAGNVGDLVIEPVAATQDTVGETTTTTAAVVYVDEWVVEPGAPSVGAAPGAAIPASGGDAVAPGSEGTVAAPAPGQSASAPASATGPARSDDPAMTDPTSPPVTGSYDDHEDDEYEDDDHEDEQDHEDEDEAEDEVEHEEEDD